MSTARQRSGLRGVSELRRALKGLPAEMRKEIGLVVADAAIQVQADMYVLAPKGETGLTSANIESRMSEDKLSARVGYLKQADDGPSSAGFVARFIEFGTKGQNGVGAQPARPFIAPALDVNETEIKARMREAVRKALAGSRIGKAFGYG